MDSYGNNKSGSSKGHRVQRRQRNKGQKQRQNWKNDKKVVKENRFQPDIQVRTGSWKSSSWSSQDHTETKPANTKIEITPEQLYWKRRHAIDISRERTNKQSLKIFKNDEPTHNHKTSYDKTSNDRASTFIAWENHIKNLEIESAHHALGTRGIPLNEMRFEKAVSHPRTNYAHMNTLFYPKQKTDTN